ncbi:prophage tail fiber N-terminal domain-containing protein [Salmonella enterica]
MTVIKGTITDATGQPLAGATITFTALQNTAEMLRGVATYITTDRGEYEFTVTPGVYSVSLAQNGTNSYALGAVHIYDDSPDGMLNSFLNAKNIDTRPEVLKQFEALVQQATDSAIQASDSETAARNAAGQAVTSGQTAASAATTATTAAGTATAAAQRAATSEQHASQSEKNAAASEASVSQTVLDITSTGETVKKAIQTQGQHFVDMAHTEATSASQSALDAQTASQTAQQAKTEVQTLADNAATSATRAQEQAGKSADAATQAITAATQAGKSATQAQAQAAHLTESVTQAQTSVTQAAASADDAQKALKAAQEIAKTPGPSAYDVWKSQQPADADTSMTAYLAFQEGKLPPLSQFGEVRSYVWGKILTQYLDSRRFPNVYDMANALIPGNCIAPVYINFHLGVPSLVTRDGGLSGTWRIMSAMTFYQDNPVTLLRRII